MSAGRIIALAFSTGLIAALALVAAHYIGEYLAALERLREARRWQRWKRKMLRSQP